MKKLVSVLLSAAIVMSLAGCTSKEETTKKKKKTKKTTEDTEDTTDEPTDDTTTEPTDEPTDTSETEDTTTTESSDTAASSSMDLTPDHTLVFDHSLEDLGVDYPWETWDWTVYHGDGSETNFVFMAIDDLYVADPDTYSNLQDTIDYYQLDHQDATAEAFDEASEKFLSDGAAGKELENTYIEFRAPMFRCDTQVFSYAITSSSLLNEGQIMTFNILSETGEYIQQSDVVTDPDGFASYAEELLSASGASDEYNTWVSDVVTSIKHEELSFVMMYDSIVLLRTSWNRCGYETYKIPVIGHEELFNMKFFGKTPKFYTLYSDNNMSLSWDFDHDGQIDTIHIDDEYQDGKGVVMTMTYNDSSTELSIENDVFYYDLMYFMVMETSYGQYLYAHFVGEDADEGTIVYTFENGKFVEVAGFGGYFRTLGYINPNAFEMVKAYDTLGSGYFYNEFFIDKNGSATAGYDEWNSTSNPVTARVDISCKLIDEYTHAPTDDYTIPAGTNLRVAYYSPATQRLIVQTLNEDSADDVYVALDFNIDADWNITVNGTSIYDQFDGIMFWG